jgi:hypothetical protein
VAIKLCTLDRGRPSSEPRVREPSQRRGVERHFGHRPHRPRHRRVRNSRAGGDPPDGPSDQDELRPRRGTNAALGPTEVAVLRGLAATEGAA